MNTIFILYCSVCDEKEVWKKIKPKKNYYKLFPKLPEAYFSYNDSVKYYGIKNKTTWISLKDVFSPVTADLQA
jgi:hypothetical protein